MPKALAIWLLALTTFSARAQPAFTVSGRIVDTSGVAIAQATIRLIAAPDGLNTAAPDTLTTVSDDNGGFVFPKLTTRTFRLKVSMKGYLPLTEKYALAEDQTTTRLQNLILRVDYQDLDPVTISRSRPFTISGDTLSYNTAAFPVREGSEVEDILKRLPGVEVDMDGNVIVQGKKLTKVLVNGKEFFGGDILLAIRNLPADIVSKLQIIDDYGDKARLTGIKVDDPSKVLNIVLKPDRRRGQFGHAQAGAGTEGKYAEDAFANAFTGDRQFSAKANADDENPGGTDPSYAVNASYADQWGQSWKPAFSASSHKDDPHSLGSSLQQSFYPGQQITQQQNSSSEAPSTTYQADGTIQFTPTPISLVRLNPSFGKSESRQQSVTTFSTIEQDSGFTKTSQGASSILSHAQGWDLGDDLYFEKTMPVSRHRFSIQSSISYTENQTTSDNRTASNITINNVSTQSLLHYLISNTSSNLMINLHSNYYIPLRPKRFLEFGYNVQSLHTRLDNVTQSPDSITGVLNTIDSLTLNEPYSTLAQQLHGGYEAAYGRLGFSSTLDGEWGEMLGNVDTKGDKYAYSYFALLPHVQLHWQLSRQQTVSFQYRGTSAIPSLQQVSPIQNVTNPQYPIKGNPDLKPSYPQSAFFSYEKSNLQATQFSGFGMSIGITVVSDPVITDITHPRDSSQVIQATTYVNAGQNRSFYFNYHFTLPAFVNKWFRFTASGGISTNQSLAMTDAQAYTNKSLAWLQQAHLQLYIPDKIELDVQGTYSLTHSTFSSPSQVPGILQTATVQFNANNRIFTHWRLDYRLTQLYTSSGGGLRSAPATLTAGLQRDLLVHNKGSIAISGFNLLNSRGAASQVVTPTSITQSQTQYIGRYFIVKFTIKLQRFH